MSIVYQNIEFFETNYVGYFVSKCGKIFSERTKRILKHKIDKDGYCVYVFSNNEMATNPIIMCRILSGQHIVKTIIIDSMF